MIAKITKGKRVGDIGAYLHGPGRANEHRWRDELGREHAGGRVIGGNMAREGDTGPEGWAADMRDTMSARPKVRQPVWHCSLRAAPGDRQLSDAEWSDMSATFMERMQLDDRPWVVVRHGDDHVHIVASRVRDDGDLWRDAHDHRRAQKVRASLEQEWGMELTPTRKGQERRRTPQREVIARHRRDEHALAGHRSRPQQPSGRSRDEAPQSRDRSASQQAATASTWEDRLRRVRDRNEARAAVGQEMADRLTAKAANRDRQQPATRSQGQPHRETATDVPVIRPGSVAPSADELRRAEAGMTLSERLAARMETYRARDREREQRNTREKGMER